MAESKIKIDNVINGTLAVNIEGGLSNNVSSVRSCGRNGILQIDCSKSSGFTAESWNTIYTSSIKPKYRISAMVYWGSDYAIIEFRTDGTVQIYPYVKAFGGFVRAVIPFFVAN